MFKYLITLCVAACMLSHTTAFALQAKSTPLEGSNTAVAYMLPGHTQASGYNVDTFYHPASTQKLLTALSATLFLGNDYTFKTKLLIASNAVRDNKPIVTNGTLNSDVVIKFVGDPTLTTSNYYNLLAVLTKYGIKQINGKVILDVSRFGEPNRAAGWSWNDLPVCFSAPSAPIILNKNCTYATLNTNGAGNVVKPHVPNGVPIDIVADAIAVNARDYGGDCELQANLYYGNKYHLTGCVPLQKNNKPYPLSLAIADPNQWGLDWTLKYLTKLGIKVSDGVELSKSPRSDLTMLAQVKSQRLQSLIKYMLERSNNLYADAIAKNLAYEYYNVPATYNRASRAIRSILKQYAKIDLSETYIVDGSGLSPHNMLRPRDLLNVLIYIKQNDKKLDLINSLPIAGKSGTMHWRRSSFEEPLKFNVIAKTGTLQNISNLAGFIKSKNNNLIPFVMFTNSISYDQNTRYKVKNRRIASPHYNYEKYVLLQIYNEAEVKKP